MVNYDSITLSASVPFIQFKPTGTGSLPIGWLDFYDSTPTRKWLVGTGIVGGTQDLEIWNYGTGKINTNASINTSGNLTAGGWVHPSNSLWGMVCSGDVMYLGKQGITNGISIDASGNATIAGSITVNSNTLLPCTAPSLTNFQLMAQIYGWIGNDWQADESGTVQYSSTRADGVQSFLPGSSYLTFKNNLASPTYANLFTVTSKDNYNAALLCLDQGLIVKKDIQAGGALFCSQGALLMGHGLTRGDDPPKISLTHSNSYINGVQSGTAFPGSPNEGDLFIHTTYTPDRLFQYVGGTWVSLGSVENWNGGWDTLYITRGNAVKQYGVPYTSEQLGNLKLYAIDAMGCIHGGGSNGDSFKVGDDCYLRDIDVANAVSFQGAQDRGSARLYLGSGNDTYIERGSTNTLYVNRNIEPAAGSNTGYLGEGGRYWYGMVSNYVYYKVLDDFDTYDDLSIVKLWGEKDKTLPKNYDAAKLTPPADDPFKIIKGNRENANTDEFFDAGKVNAFLMGCAKALAKKQDQHDETQLAMFNKVESQQKEIDDLRSQLQNLIAKGGVSA